MTGHELWHHDAMFAVLPPDDRQAEPLVPRGGEVFAQGGAEIDECAVLFVECAEFGLKGRDEPSRKRLSEHVGGLKGFVEGLLMVLRVNIITYCGAIF